MLVVCVFSKRCIHRGYGFSLLELERGVGDVNVICTVALYGFAIRPDRLDGRSFGTYELPLSVRLKLVVYFSRVVSTRPSVIRP